jgi:enamine deaminase RidA (YjgF/YER057c/UK114 family)
VVQDGWIFVSGCLGVDPNTAWIAESVEEQTRQCFRNIEWALAEAGASLSDVVRAVYIIADAADAERIYPIFREHFGECRPAATAFVARLLDPRAKIEIEVIAIAPKPRVS